MWWCLLFWWAEVRLNPSVLQQLISLLYQPQMTDKWMWNDGGIILPTKILKIPTDFYQFFFSLINISSYNFSFISSFLTCCYQCLRCRLVLNNFMTVVPRNNRVRHVHEESSNAILVLTAVSMVIYLDLTTWLCVSMDRILISTGITLQKFWQDIWYRLTSTEVLQCGPHHYLFLLTLSPSKNWYNWLFH